MKLFQKEKIEEKAEGENENSKTISLFHAAERREKHLIKRLAHLKKFNFDTEEAFYEKRAKLQKEFAEISQTRLSLQREYDTQQKEETIARTQAILKKAVGKEFLVIEADRKKVKIDKATLSVTVGFTNCKHTKQFSLNSLIPYTKESLWQDIINGMAITISRSCNQCIKQNRNLLAKFRIWNTKPAGTVSITIRGLH